MKRFVPYLLLAALCGGWYMASPVSTPYSELKETIADGKAVSVKLTDTYITVTYPDGTTHESRLPKEDPALMTLLEDMGVPYEVGSQSLFSTVIGMVPTFLMIAFMFWFVFGKGFDGLKQKVNEATAKKQNKVTFADVAGYGEVKAELADVIDYLRDPKEYGRLGAKPPKGILLEGPPGTGKTFLARAVAGESDVKFIDVTGASFASMFMSVSGTQVRQLFERARAAAPCIIFIDEIDALAGKRRSGGPGSAAERDADSTLNTLLTEMDGFRPSDGIVVIGATNRADVLDPAIMRGGRFDRHVQVGLPDQRSRRDILAQYAAKVRCTDDVNLDQLAVLTVGLAGAHLANLVNEATIIATRRKADAVSMEDFLSALERERVGVGSARRISEEDRRRVAAHESGHAIAAAAAGIGRKVRKVTILGRGRTLGYNLIIPEEGDDLIQTREEFIQEICALLGGTAAEEIAFGGRSSGAASDLEQVERIAHLMVARLGLGKALPYRMLDPNVPYPPALIQAVDDEKTRIVAECYGKVLATLTASRGLLDQMTNTLLVQDTLNGDALQALLAKVQTLDTPSPS